MRNRKVGMPLVADEQTLIIILGSMPGDQSLRQQQYYANPRNQFWSIMYSLFRRTPSWDYKERISFLREVKIGVWDVLMTCQRAGSSDASIRDGEVNDFDLLFKTAPMLRCIALNGGKAQSAFDAARIELPRNVQTLLLPSSSGALARPLEDKIKSWRRLLSFLK